MAPRFNLEENVFESFFPSNMNIFEKGEGLDTAWIVFCSRQTESISGILEGKCQFTLIVGPPPVLLGRYG